MITPSGHGIYARALPDSYLSRFDFIAVTAARSDSDEDIARARARGQQAWLFDDPAEWTPRNWRATLDRMLSVKRETGATGIIADLENAWPGASESDARAVAEGLARASLQSPIGITKTEGTDRWNALWSGILRGRVFVSPQLYPESPVSGRYPLSRLAEWYAEDEQLFGVGSVIPSVRLWTGDPPSRWVTDPIVYAQYIAAIPRARATIAWPTGVPPEWMTQIYLRSAVLPAIPIALLVLLAGAAWLLYKRE